MKVANGIVPPLLRILCLVASYVLCASRELVGVVDPAFVLLDLFFFFVNIEA